MPEIIIVAGPNGAGKTSFASQYLANEQDVYYVNADEIARKLPNNSDFRAGRKMLQRITELTQLKADFVIETTLASLTYAKKIPLWQSQGYKVVLLYVRLPSVEHSIYRVRNRVKDGGHDIPEASIRRRFPRSLDYLEKIYKPVVDEWYIFDSLEGRFEPAESWKDT